MSKLDVLRINQVWIKIKVVIGEEENRHKI